MVFKIVENLLEQAEAGKKPLVYQKQAIQAVDTFLRRPQNVTRRAPHVRDATDLKRYMFMVVVSLVPALLFGIYNTGRNAYLSIGVEPTLGQAFLEGALHVVPLIIISYAVGGAVEMIFAEVRGHEIAEGFLVTGMLYPLVCPPTIPWWMFATGIVFGVLIGKEVFGGTGMNILNPALTSRAYLFFAYPAFMSGDVWVAKPFHRLADGTLAANAFTTIPRELIDQFIAGARAAVDGFSGATALAYAATNQADVDSVQLMLQKYSVTDMFLGFIPGSIGETSTLMILLGGLLLIVLGIGSWRTMAGVFLGGFGTALAFYLLAGPNSPTMFHMPPYMHLLIGGFAFGAVFMATDPVSSPFHRRSKWIYGLLIGALAVLIRNINPAYPEGMMLAILFMNVFAPLIDHYVVASELKKRRAQR